MLRIKTILIALLPFVLVSSVSHAFCFEEAGAEYSVSADLLRSIAAVESSMDPNAVHRNANGSMDFGLMQVNSWWIHIIGQDLWMRLGDPCTNVRVGAWILAQCVQQYGYTWEAVGCYNAKSPTKRVVYENKVYRVLTASYSRGN